MAPLASAKTLTKNVTNPSKEDMNPPSVLSPNKYLSS